MNSQKMKHVSGSCPHLGIIICYSSTPLCNNSGIVSEGRRGRFTVRLVRDPTLLCHVLLSRSTTEASQSERSCGGRPGGRSGLCTQGWGEFLVFIFGRSFLSKLQECSLYLRYHVLSALRCVLPLTGQH